MKYPFLFVLILLSHAVFSQKTLVFGDKVYEPQIKTVQLYPDSGAPDDPLYPAVTSLSAMRLVLEFDDLQANRSNYYARIIHCNYDWTKSSLMDLDFLNDYNEYTLNDYAYSGNTHIPYVHYRFAIPPVKIAGNYLIIIYREGDKSDLLLSRRFMVFFNQVTFTQDPVTGTGSSMRQSNQQLNFTVDYSRMEIMNPLESVHIVLRQNQRWDNAKFDIKPSFVRDGDSQLEFHFFDQDKTFNGGNEFRFVDFRSLAYPGQNTGVMNRTVKPFALSVQVDQPRTDQAYAQNPDIDGNYLMENKDNGDARTGSNYLEVTFTLKPFQPLSDPVYVIGAFNNWGREDDNRMKYYSGKGVYESTLLLKQGLYDYAYWVESSTLDGNYFEGNHFETQNVYEVLVYNRSFQRNIDQLIGYFVIPVNSR